MAMAQQQPAQITFREEERVLGIAYDRAVPMMPSLVKKSTGADVEELGDGYWVATIPLPYGGKREVTVRLGKQGPDTRFSVRAESSGGDWRWITAVVVIGVVTMGLGILAFIPAMQSRLRKEQRERDLLVHKTFRAIEDAVAEQGASPGYRIAPGEGAVEPERESEPEAEAASRRARA